MLFSLGKIVALELADHRHTVIFGRHDNFITLLSTTSKGQASAQLFDYIEELTNK
jgi:hypothetical protein